MPVSLFCEEYGPKPSGPAGCPLAVAQVGACELHNAVFTGLTIFFLLHPQATLRGRLTFQNVVVLGLRN